MAKVSDSKSKVNFIPIPKNKFRVELILPSGNRNLGIIDTSGEGYFVTTRTQKHIYKRYNSFGLNYDLIHNSKIEFKWIIIKCGETEYISTREYFKQRGKPTGFTKKGFELQLHVPIDELNIETVKVFEKQPPFQFSFFDKDVDGDYANA